MHTYTRRFQALLAESTQRVNSRRVSTAVTTLAGLAAQHRPTVWLRVLRVLLVAPLSLLFGRIRGPRAARRLLFELSWRIAGAKTYSASGWPGRLFYRES